MTDIHADYDRPPFRVLLQGRPTVKPQVRKTLQGAMKCLLRLMTRRCQPGVVLNAEAEPVVRSAVFCDGFRSVNIVQYRKAAQFEKWTDTLLV